MALVPTLPVSVTQCGADPTGNVDSTKAFNVCLSASPEGDIFVPAGSYEIAGSILKNRNQNLIGAGAKATILNCRSTKAPCIVVADTASIMNYSGSRIQDLTVQGPGDGNSSIGVYLGGDPNGTFSPVNAYGDAANLVDARVTGFNHGVEWGNNAWCNKLVRTLVFGNTSGIYVPAGLGNSGENVGMTDSNVFNNGQFGLEDHGNFEWMISGTSFDYNGTAIEFFGATINAVNCHFEQEGAQVVFQPYGSGSLSIRDSEILVQSGSGTDQFILSTWPQNLNLAIDNVSIWSNHPVQYFMHAQGYMTGSVSNLHGNGNKMIQSFADALMKAAMTASSAF